MILFGLIRRKYGGKIIYISLIIKCKDTKLNWVKIVKFRISTYYLSVGCYVVFLYVAIEVFWIFIVWTIIGIPIIAQKHWKEKENVNHLLLQEKAKCNGALGLSRFFVKILPEERRWRLLQKPVGLDLYWPILLRFTVWAFFCRSIWQSYFRLSFLIVLNVRGFSLKGKTALSVCG